jgi:hypothetical protein
MKFCRGPGRLARPGSSSCPSYLTSALENVENTYATINLYKIDTETQTVGNWNQHKKDGLFEPSFLHFFQSLSQRVANGDIVLLSTIGNEKSSVYLAR